MGKSKLKGKDLRSIDYQTDKSKSLAIDIMSKHFKHCSKKEKLEILTNVKQDPEKFENDEVLGILADEFIEKVSPISGNSYRLDDLAKPFNVFGGKLIDSNTVSQMEKAMLLPISVDGALMPDAHVGYGLPIGGVLATKNAVIPYGVGLDIGCRMSLTIFDAQAGFIQRYNYQIKEALKSNTHFGIGKIPVHNEEHEVLDRIEFQENPLLKQLHGKAQNQLGSSGSGNHFVEFGEVILSENNVFNLQSGTYVGLLTHSGSRGLGANIASHYTQIAMKQCRLPQSAKHLAWLDMHSQEGIEYWNAMNLAGDYAKACHDVIHRKLAKALGIKPIVAIENHHNFAWKEMHNGEELIVHRKGATPAHEGTLGIIPATMIHPGYIVSGCGNASSLNSASHGAGRRLSRSKAKESITGSEIKKQLKQAGVELIGGSRDEAPNAYKTLDEVMSCQKELVKIEGTFTPKIIRMDK